MVRKLAAAGAALVLSCAAASAQVVAIGTNPPGTIAYPTGAAIAKVATADQFQVRVQPNGGPNVGVPQVAAGELDFRIINMMVAVFAHTGTAISPARGIRRCGSPRRCSRSGSACSCARTRRSGRSPS